MNTLDEIKKRFEEVFQRHYDPWIASQFAEEYIPELIARVQRLEKDWYASNKVIAELEKEIDRLRDLIGAKTF